MSGTAEIYYHRSGRVSSLILSKFVLTGIPPTVIAGAIYAVFIRYNPFIYFSFIGTLVFGFIIGLAAEAVIKRGKSRSLVIDMIVALALALIGLWASWLVWVWLMLGKSQAQSLLSATPAQWLDFLSWLAHNMTETVAKYMGAGTKSQPASPTELSLQWSIEAVLIIGTSLLITAANSQNRIFSERTGHWATEQFKGEIGAFTESPEQLRLAFEKSDFTALNSIHRFNTSELDSGIREWKSLELTLIADADDTDLHVMHLDALENHFDSKGKPKNKSRTTVVKYLLLPKQVYDMVLSQVSKKNESE